MSLKSLFYKLTKSTGFIIEITNGKATLVNGKVSASFIYDCNNILAEAGIDKGIIYSVVHPNQSPIINASGEIPKEVLQQLRNLWGVGR